MKLRSGKQYIAPYHIMNNNTINNTNYRWCKTTFYFVFWMSLLSILSLLFFTIYTFIISVSVSSIVKNQNHSKMPITS